MLLFLLWDKAKDFLQRAFTVIFIATIIIWFLQTFDFNSISSRFPQQHFGWRCRSHLPHFLHRSALPIGESLPPSLRASWRKKAWSLPYPFSLGELNRCFAILTLWPPCLSWFFSLLYTPVSPLSSSVKRELGAKWAVAVVIGQCVIAWLAAFVVKLIGSAYSCWQSQSTEPTARSLRTYRHFRGTTVYENPS